jgi:ATP-binding cassette subfamily B protein
MRRALAPAWPYLKRYRRGLTVGLVTILLMELVAIGLPLLIRRGVDGLTRGESLQVIFVVSAAMIAAAALKGVLQFWSRMAFIGISRDVEYDLRNDLFRHLVTLSPDFYQKTPTGDLMARATNDLNAVRLMIGPGLMNWLDSCFAFVPAFIVMLSVDWRLTLVALLPTPLLSLTVVWFGRTIHRRFERIQAAFSDISSRVQENIAGVRVVRAYAQEGEEIAKFMRLDREYVRLNLRLAWLSGIFTPLLQFLMGLTSLAVLWLGGYRVLEGRLTLGSYVMFNTYMALLLKPMVAIGRVMNIMQRGTASLQRIVMLMHERPTIAPPSGEHALAVPPLRGEIDLHGVAIRFPSGPALDGVSLRVPAGTTIAIVGATGSGKSTLASLIPRLLDPQCGEVSVDGIGARGYVPAELRRHIGMVTQETFLFSATLAANLKFGAEHASDERMRWAAEVACLTPDIETFPRGYDTVVGERGLSLSGGQKQRAAIARAILRDPRILILDDAFASVDTETEEKILLALRDVIRERTTILISHRASTVRHADRIVVLDNGRIVQQGSHAQLLAEQGYYAGLYRDQLLEEALDSV